MLEVTPYIIAEQVNAVLNWSGYVSNQSFMAVMVQSIIRLVAKIRDKARVLSNR